MTTVADLIRPSKLGAIDACNGAPQMEARAITAMPVLELLESPQAITGTLCHLLIAQTLTMIYHGEGPTFQPPEDCLAKMAGAMAQLTEWDRDVVRRCVAYAVALIDKHVPNRDGIIIEKKLCGKLVGIPRGGTADLVLVAGDIVIVIDQKCGFLDQGPADEHEQAAAYAVMAFDKWHPREVHVHIAQGRLSPSKRFTSAIYSAEAIEVARRFVIGLVAEAAKPTARLTPSITACRYCKALVVCRAAREHFMRANDDLAMFGVPDSDDERVRLAEAAQIAKAFADQVKALQRAWVEKAQGAA